MLIVPVLASLVGTSIKMDEIRFFANLAGMSYCSKEHMMHFSCLEHCNSRTQSLKYVDFYENGSLNVVVMKNKTHLFFSFKGSVQLQDFLLDAKVGLVPLSKGHLLPATLKKGVKVHNGFQEAWLLLRSFTLLMTRHSKLSIVCAGHSLGGAIASLAALELSLMKRVTLVTVAGPKVGNYKFAWLLAHMVRSISRITNKNDIAPLIPPTWMGYRHAPREIYISPSNVTIYCSTTIAEDEHCILSQWPKNRFWWSHVYVYDIHVGLSC